MYLGSMRYSMRFSSINDQKGNTEAFGSRTATADPQISGNKGLLFEVGVEGMFVVQHCCSNS